MERQGLGFTPASYSDLPLYNIQAVSAATGVPAITLRSWERRYGLPRPHRDAKGYRLYSERDIAITRWLRERVQRGVGIGRAVHMLRALEGSQAEAGQRPGYDLGALLERLLDASVRLDEAGASQALAEALTVAPVETVALELVQPVLHAIGERWASGDLSVTVEHFSLNILRNQIAQLLRISPAPIRAAQIVVACAPGELHDVGALMLALFLRRRGWDVVFVGASVEPEDFIADVALIQPTAVLISASRAEMALGMEAMLRELSAQYQGILGLGGRAFNVEPELRGALPGIYLGNDAAQATAALEDALLNAGRGAV